MKPYGMQGKERITCKWGCCHKDEHLNPFRKAFYLVKRTLKKKARRDGKKQSNQF